jgi:selenocysteine-specific elongation factor
MLLIKSRFSAREIADAVATLASQRKVIADGSIVADAAWWEQLRQQAIDAIQAEHRSHPEQAGLRLVDLRQHLAGRLGRTGAFDVLLAELCRNGCVRTRETIRLANHRPALPPRLMAAGTQLRKILASRGLDAPSRKELAPDTVTQQALRFLVQTGEAVEIGDDLVLQAEHYARAVQTVRDHLSTKGAATVSELKQALNTSRRIMVPLLEKLDKEGVTLRQGDQRVLRQPKATADS